MLTTEDLDRLETELSLVSEVAMTISGNESLVDIMWLQAMPPSEHAMLKTLSTILLSYLGAHGSILFDVYSEAFDGNAPDDQYPIKKDYSFYVKADTLSTLTGYSSEEVHSTLANLNDKAFVHVSYVDSVIRIMPNYMCLYRMGALWKKQFGKWEHYQIAPASISRILQGAEDGDAIIRGIMTKLYEELAVKE